jgi:hypothetical protein
VRQPCSCPLAESQSLKGLALRNSGRGKFSSSISALANPTVPGSAHGEERRFQHSPYECANLRFLARSRSCDIENLDPVLAAESDLSNRKISTDCPPRDEGRRIFCAPGASSMTRVNLMSNRRPRKMSYGCPHRFDTGFIPRNSSLRTVRSVISRICLKT